MTQQATFQSNLSQFISSLTEAFQPNLLIPSLIAGLVTGAIGTIRGISYAALIFSGTLSTHLSNGVGMAVLSTAIINIVVALTSGLPGMIATPLAAPTAILAIMAGAIAQKMATHATPEAIYLTVASAIALSSLLTGLFLLLLGKFKLGDAIRFIPYPVVGGFMAGTGWLLVDGFFQVTTDLPLTLSNLSPLLNSNLLWQWLSGAIFAVLLLGISNRFKHYFVIPGTLLAFVGIFYLALFLTHTPIVEARTEGWLLGPFPEGGLWQPLDITAFDRVSWSAIFAQTSSIATLMLVCLLSLVLSNSGIELVVGRDIDLNNELQSIGFACLSAGLGSGMVGNQALPSTLLVHDIGGKSRLTGIFAAIPCLAVLLLGSSFLSFLPKPVLGALLLYLGLSLLVQWLYKAWFKLPLADYLIVVAILVAINIWGFLQGIVVGFVFAVVLFMYRYSQVNVAPIEASGAIARSNVQRNSTQQNSLQTQGEQIYILELQGFLFFGTANYLLNRARSRVEQHPQNPLRFILIDFRQVTGLDSSAVLSFDKILKIARKHSLTLIFTNLSPTFQSQLVLGGVLPKNDEETSCEIFPDIDRGLEWCENQVLEAISCIEPSLSLSQQLSQIFLEASQVSEFMTYLEPQTIDAGCTVFHQGEPSDHLYFLESGQVSVLLDLPNQQTKRLQTVCEGNILGEMRFYDKPSLSTSVVADTSTSLYGLSKTAFSQMKAEAPALAVQLEAYIVRVLCDSLARREQQLQVMN
ncbi:SLC26A/SulP transporter family protein [Lusitaniella coriacea]|uniref:SLC26A/SulP transporter family protein n=1 Tax=Lusitaniella coriacea TaxID=1983105 RepID=UPI003CF57249